jgi:hypothetical protein
MLSQNSCDYGSAVALGCFIALVTFAIILLFEEEIKGIFRKKN